MSRDISSSCSTACAGLLGDLHDTPGLVSVDGGERGFVSDRCPGIRGAWRALLMAGCRCRLLGSMALDPSIGLTVLADAAVGHPAAGPLRRRVARLQGQAPASR